MENSKNILVLCGHPNKDSFTGQIADHYQTSAEDAGHYVNRINIGELNFDPILRKGFHEIQPLEPDLELVQEAIRQADHVVIIYPNWWCTMPALLKGLFDRIWLPGFAFNFNEETKKTEQHLKGKTARVIILSGAESPFKTWWKYGDYTNEIQYAILDFAGIKTNVSAFGPSDQVDEKMREKWLKEAEVLGKKGA